MMLIVCDAFPISAAIYLVNIMGYRYAFKQLIELAQLVSSAGFSTVYKKRPQGKEIQDWIRRNPQWTHDYMMCLQHECRFMMSDKTCSTLSSILNALPTSNMIYTASTCIFRYSKDYKSSYQTNSELPINIGAKEYRKYLEWKKEHVYNKTKTKVASKKKTKVQK